MDHIFLTPVIQDRLLILNKKYICSASIIKSSVGKSPIVILLLTLIDTSDYSTSGIV